MWDAQRFSKVELAGGSVSRRPGKRRVEIINTLNRDCDAIRQALGKGRRNATFCRVYRQ